MASLRNVRHFYIDLASEGASDCYRTVSRYGSSEHSLLPEHESGQLRRLAQATLTPRRLRHWFWHNMWFRCRTNLPDQSRRPNVASHWGHSVMPRCQCGIKRLSTGWGSGKCLEDRSRHLYKVRHGASAQKLRFCKFGKP